MQFSEQNVHGGRVGRNEELDTYMPLAGDVRTAVKTMFDLAKRKSLQAL